MLLLVVLKVSPLYYYPHLVSVNDINTQCSYLNCINSLFSKPEIRGQCNPLQFLPGLLLYFHLY